MSKNIDVSIEDAKTRLNKLPHSEALKTFQIREVGKSSNGSIFLYLSGAKLTDFALYKFNKNREQPELKALTKCSLENLICSLKMQTSEFQKSIADLENSNTKRNLRKKIQRANTQVQIKQFQLELNDTVSLILRFKII